LLGVIRELLDLSDSWVAQPYSIDKLGGKAQQAAVINDVLTSEGLGAQWRFGGWAGSAIDRHKGCARRVEQPGNKPSIVNPVISPSAHQKVQIWKVLWHTPRPLQKVAGDDLLAGANVPPDCARLVAAAIAPTGALAAGLNAKEVAHDA
jgi:hypothetical protein